MNSNVIAMEKPQSEVKPARFKITAELDGFLVEIEVEGKADNLKALVERLKQIGAKPAGKVSPISNTIPSCPIHKRAMKASRKPGTFFCPGRNDDGSYCTEKA